MTSDLNLGISHTSSPESSSEPRTPNSPMLPLPVSNENTATHTTAATAGPPKRKPSRRANTAERRATHNAVERQRRETLNGRFLDLAALLPNLSQIRRPSKSSIVNSSIAHVHASRRHRMLASRELRSLKGEADALRRELNEWRDRANVPRIEEPTRGEGFSMILSGELEVLVVNGPLEEEDEEMGDVAYPADDTPAYAEVEDHSRFAAQQHLMKQQQQQPSQPFAHQVPPPRLSLTLPATLAAHGHGPTHMMGGPMIASPTGMSFDGPVLGAYHEQHVQGYPAGGPPGSAGGYSFNSHPHSMDEKQWGMYQQQMMQRAMSSHASSPPGSSSGLSSISAQEYNMRASGPGIPTGPIEIRGARERSGSFGRAHFSGGSGGSPSDRGSPPQFDQHQQWIMKQQQQQQQHGQPQRYGVF